MAGVFLFERRDMREDENLRREFEDEVQSGMVEEHEGNAIFGGCVAMLVMVAVLCVVVLVVWIWREIHGS